jgi:ABC-type transporter Mla maintaining outer membrane lipid asymmetry ATPase subunit MlaF
MLKRITIENFRGFKQLDIAQDLGPVTVLMGPNSSGKTTVLHAIRLACQMMDLALDSDAPVRVTGSSIEVANNTLVESPSHLLPLADWQALFVDQLVSEGITSTVVLKFDDLDEISSLRLVLSYARNRQLKFSLTVDAPQALPLVATMPKKSPKVSMALTAWLRQHAPRAVFIPPFYGVVREEEYRPRVVVDKLVGSGDQSHVVRNLITGLESHQLTRLNAFLTELIGASISYRTSGDKVETESPLRVEFQDTNGGIEISAAGAGLVNLIALYASLARWQANARTNLVMFLLDEPEAHLHPRLQGSTAQRMVSLVTQEFGAQLFLATHSVEIINRLGDDPATTLLRTDRAAMPSATVLSGQTAVLGDLANWADLTPFTAINFMASRRVLFHEGPSDAKVLKRCAELRFRQQADKRRNFERWALVPLDGSGNDKMVGLLQRLLASPVWAAAQGVQPFKVVTVLDRDYARQSGFEVRPVVDGPMHAELVWSRHSIESVFLTAKVLGYWVRAFAGDCASPDLDGVITQALAHADSDDGLNTNALDKLMAWQRKQSIQSETGVELAANTDSHFQRTLNLARARFSAEGPAVLQRGKDRAAKVLGFIRNHIALPKQNSFPTDVIKLIDRVDLNEISDPVAAIPQELLELLDWMVEQS